MEILQTSQSTPVKPEEPQPRSRLLPALLSGGLFAFLGGVAARWIARQTPTYGPYHQNWATGIGALFSGTVAAYGAWRLPEQSVTQEVPEAATPLISVGPAALVSQTERVGVVEPGPTKQR
jgi:hypothetical protein